MNKINKSKVFLSLLVLPFVLSQQAFADEVVLDDQIIVGSQCVGESCTVDEFLTIDPITGQPLPGTFDTLRLKASDPIISFIDTSTSALFPSVDWAMGIQNSATETSYFFVKDVDSGADVLKMSASSNGGVALGANSVLIDNAISVGDSGSERIISHVADGVDPNDAVNKGQFDATMATFDTQLSTIESDLAALSIRIDDVVVRLNALP